MTETTPHGPKPDKARSVTRVRLVFDSFRQFLTEYGPHISMGGMFIGARAPLPPGSLCQLDFRLRDGYPLILGSGEVVWTRARDEGRGRPPGMGVRFHDLEGSSRDLVFGIVEHRLADGDSLFELDESGELVDSSPEEIDRLLAEAERRRERAEAELAAGAAGLTLEQPTSRGHAEEAAPEPPSASEAASEEAEMGDPEVADPTDPTDPRPVVSPPEPAGELGQEPPRAEPFAGASELPLRRTVPETRPAPEAERDAQGEAEPEPGTGRPAAAGDDELGPPMLATPIADEREAPPAAAERWEAESAFPDERQSASGDGDLPTAQEEDAKPILGSLVAESADDEPGRLDLGYLYPPAPADAEPEASTLDAPPVESEERRGRRGLFALLVGLVTLAVAAVILVRVAGWWPPPDSVEDPAAIGRAADRAGAEAESVSGSAPELVEIDARGASAEPPAESAADPPPAPVSSAPAPEADSPAEAPSQPADPARTVETIRWAREDGATRVTVQLDGRLSDERLSNQRLGSGAPRQLLRLLGVGQTLQPPTLAVGTEELLRIRTGRHFRNGANELHLVLDLADASTRVTRVETTDDRLEIWIEGG